MRKHPRVDRNQREIVTALRKVGATVQSLASVGGGCPDLLIGYKGENFLFEVKDYTRPAARRCLTAAEDAWHCRWCGAVYIVGSVAEVLSAVGIDD